MSSGNKRQYFLAAFLLITVLYYLIDADIIKLGGKTDDTGAAQTEPAIEQVQPIQAVIPDLSRLESMLREDWPSQMTRDPFYYVTADLEQGDGLLFGKAAANAALSLTGISCIGNSCTAIVNSNVVREGDLISGYEVDKIELKYIILSKGEDTIRLILNE